MTIMTASGQQISRLAGYAPALPTPFDAEGAVDAAAFERLCHRQIEMGATALVVCGTTGEAPTLRPAEHHILVRIAVDAARGRIPVIAGAGCNSTAHAIELTRDAEAGGADAVLSVVPYYNKPTQDGLYAHFSAIACSTGLPVFLYDVPARSACALADDTVARLSDVPNIVGLKDATGDVSRPARLKRLVGTEFRLLSGDDATALGFLAQGGHGCISVTSNLAPGLCRELFLAFKQGEMGRARRMASIVGQLTAVLFRETSPVPLKYALSLMGLMLPTVRLPLVELSAQTRAEVSAVVMKTCDAHRDDLIGSADRSIAPRREYVLVQ